MGKEDRVLQAECSLQLPYTFCVGEHHIKKLCDLFRQHIGSVEMVADCADDVRREFEDPEGLFAFENPKSKAVRGLRISARSDDYRVSAALDFRGSGWRGISLTIRASDTVVSNLKEGTLDILSGMRPWYSSLQRLDFLYALGVVWIVVYLALLSLVALKVFPSAQSKEDDASWSALARSSVWGVAGIAIAGALALNRVRDILFPPAVFLIGQGEQRFKCLEKFQWLFVAFLVSLLPTLVIAVWR